ncbi:sigma factor-like helix-turn-helix DNA-binding protein [Catenibacterium sp.]
MLFYRYIECLSVYDIAEIMDYSPATVRTYICKRHNRISQHSRVMLF